MPSTFVPADLDATRFANVEPLIRVLLDRPVADRAGLEAWILDRGELAAAIGEARARLYIAMTCNTEDASAQAAYSLYVEEVQPRLTPLFFELDSRLVRLEAASPLPAARYGVLVRNTKADVSLFRPENVPIETELAKLAQTYEQIAGAQRVQYDGEERTLPQMARYQEVTDRAVRERAWRAVASRRLEDAPSLDALYDDMVSRRDRLGRNAGFAGFTPYAFTMHHRFDYDVSACERFHEGVERCVVPLAREVEEERRRRLGVERLRPWDLAVDAKGRPPLRPFEGGADLVARTRRVFASLDPRLAAMFESLGDGRGRVRSAADAGRVRLDLDSRPGKAPGGYQYALERSRQAFIFMNAAGLQRDVETMVHEAGHAFHSMVCAAEDVREYRESPTEFAEVASMSMEMLTMRHWGAFYERAEDLARAQREMLERSVVLLPWIATIDAFQHWVYANPGAGVAARAGAWRAMHARFGTTADWSGLERERDALWHRQLHLFTHPLYYIEYGIAHLGALSLWLFALERGEKAAIDRYLGALRLGGSRPLPALFDAAGLTLDFGPENVRRLTDRVRAELAKIPA